MAEEQKQEEKKEEAKEEKKEGESVEVPAKFKKLIEEIEKMSVLELAELVKILEKKFGVSAAPQMVAAAPAAAQGADATADEKSSFNIVLTAVGDKKIEVIKAVRDITQKGLKDSKDIVDAVASGEQVVKENVKKEEAEEMKKKFEAAGAKVELK
ncbi:MAG TPA: 50S ribosomal protein L7/L12 [bacterium]|nr:50S ribosomal protein L7/L12 [bacterium]